MIFSIAYNTETGQLATDKRLEGFASLTFSRAEGADTFSLKAVGPEGTVKTFGRTAAGEQEVEVADQVAADIEEYLRPDQLCDED